MYSLQFSKKFPLPKNGGHFEFSNFCQKMAKHKFASISLTVRNRAISSKFSICRISKKCTLGNFQKIFPSPHMAAILKAYTVALEKQLEGSRVTRKGDSSPQVAPPPPKVVAGGKHCATRSTITPYKTYSANTY